MILLLPVSFAQELTSGVKIHLQLADQSHIEGWISTVRSDCLYITNKDGRKGLSPAIIESFRIDGEEFTAEILQQEMERVQTATTFSVPVERPKRKEVYLGLSIINSGIPFAYTQDSQDAWIAGTADALISLGAGVALYQRRAIGVPIWMLLGGFKAWSAFEAHSRQTFRWERYKKDAKVQDAGKGSALPCL
ncbi:MAG: hypothetical protein VX278_22775 [Myxococcota bacterium]|nr:hypothetical protein [Myxococcota bacterium]